MSIKVNSPDPIVEKAARKLLGIEGVPPKEQARMVRRSLLVVADGVSRLRAANAELVEALRYVKNSMETDQMLEGIDFGNELYVMNEALSRAEQEKPTLDLTKAEWADEERASIEQKPETCVWNYNPAGVWNAACGVVCIGLEAMTFCPVCNKRVEVKE